MTNKKSSWEYQRNRYKQLNIKFDMSDSMEALLHHFITTQKNSSALVKKLIYEELVRCAYEEE